MVKDASEIPAVALADLPADVDQGLARFAGQMVNSSGMPSDGLPTLHVVGDSISMRYGPHLEQMLMGIAAYSRKPTVDDDPESANGRDSDTVFAYLSSLPPERRRSIRYLMINCGLHDIRRDPTTGAIQAPRDRYAANLRAIVRYAREIGARLIWVRTTPVVDAIHNAYPDVAFHRHAEDVDAYNATANAIMVEAGVPIIDLHTFTHNLGSHIYCDHVHFVEAVSIRQAAFIAGALYQIINRS